MFFSGLQSIWITGLGPNGVNVFRGVAMVSQSQAASSCGAMRFMEPRSFLFRAICGVKRLESRLLRGASLRRVLYHYGMIEVMDFMEVPQCSCGKQKRVLQRNLQ